MKKHICCLFVVTAILILMSALTFLFKNAALTKPAILLKPTPSSDISSSKTVADNPNLSALDRMKTVKYNGETFRFAWIKIGDPRKLSLLPNFENKKAAKNLRDRDKCQILVNAGFYGKNNQPIGWWESLGKNLGAPVKSALLNGFLTIDDFGRAEISSINLGNIMRIGLQSGPLLVLDGKQLPLTIHEDEKQRRIIAMITDEQGLIFAAVSGDDSLFSGPLLADMPRITLLIGKTIGKNIVSAINLDGGSASAFLTPEIELDEVSFIGSYFCYFDFASNAK